MCNGVSTCRLSALFFHFSVQQCIRYVSEVYRNVSSVYLLQPVTYFHNTILHQTGCHCVSTFRGSCSSRFIFLGSCFTSVSGACHFISNDRLINQCSERCITIPLYPWKCFFVFPLEGTLFPISGFLFPGVSKMFFCDSFCFQQEFRVPLEENITLPLYPVKQFFVFTLAVHLFNHRGFCSFAFTNQFSGVQFVLWC